MCGITGIFAFKERGKDFFSKIDASVSALSKRGPDGNGTFKHNNIALGHARLSIIDTSPAGAQPATDITGRYTIVFNGEFYNYREHRNQLIKKGVEFKSESDTEVLLYLYIQDGEKCLDKINGFFAFAIYDKVENSLFIARDRMGIKPLLIYQDEDKLIFASEMKAIMAFGIKKEIDTTSLYTYLQLNYIPAPNSIFKDVRKLNAGNFLKIKDNQVINTTYYKIPFEKDNNKLITNYEDAKKELFKLVEDSVKLRLVADVPLGTFLSGGIDSSITTALAARHHKDLNSFSIGYKNEPLFDETKYAELVAKKHKTNHTVFSLTNDDFFENLYEVLDYIDEPFADSSAIAVYILSKNTRKKVTVALSGDGADELFGGYNKHMAEYKARKKGSLANLVRVGLPLWSALPKSRNSKFGNKIRQLEKFAEGLNLSEKERYWQWAGTLNEKEALKTIKLDVDIKEYNSRKAEALKEISADGNLNDFLYTDSHLVLQNDMLTKVDLMSMANSLEVRVPFLDYKIANFAFSIPEAFKVDGKMKKKILQDTFRDILPAELYDRPKQGFEVPLLRWFQTELKSLITEDLLSKKLIKEQNIFNPETIEELKRKLFSTDPGDSVATVWSLIVFQYWWKKEITNS